MSLFDLLAGAGSAAAGYQMAEDIRQTGRTGAQQMQQLGQQLQDQSAFRGYGVQTGLGRSTISPMGSTDVGVGPQAGLMQGGQQLYGGAQAALGQVMQPPAAREQAIFERAMAMQEPGLQRAQAAQQAREFAMGRGGLRGAQFGGTAEDAAMARARAEASNAAAFQAMQQAQQEAQTQTQAANVAGQLGLQGYTTAFTPIQQQLNALQVAQQAANMAQTGQLTGTGYGAQLGLGGIQARINAEKAASELFGNLFGSGMAAIGSIGTGAPAGSSLLEQLGLPGLFSSAVEESAGLRALDELDQIDFGAIG
jgi:hypothetical protein